MKAGAGTAVSEQAYLWYGFCAKQITLSCNVCRMLAAPLSHFSWKRGKWRRAGRGDY